MDKAEAFYKAANYNMNALTTEVNAHGQILKWQHER